MSSVSETDEKYSMDTYFRQSWFDPRLRFSLPGIDEFSMSWLFLDRVWKPDTYIVNGHRSYLHRITVPNKFARVRSDGFVTYSMRLTLQANCPMHLRKFPLDSQRCPLLIGSYGYTASDILYAWHPTGVGLEPGVELAQYDLVNITTVNAQLIRRGADEYSMISASFNLKRNTGYYTLQVFVPCGLIVCSSWVSFWIDPDAVPARVSLAVTTVLSMTTMGFGGRASMPRVNYATALDWFVIMCFAFVFAVMLEYAAINFIDKVTEDLRRLLEERKKKRTSVASAAKVEPPPADGRAGPSAGQRSRTPSLAAGVAGDASDCDSVYAQPAPLAPLASPGHATSPTTTQGEGVEDAVVTSRAAPLVVNTASIPNPSQPPSSTDEIEYADDAVLSEVVDVLTEVVEVLAASTGNAVGADCAIRIEVDEVAMVQLAVPDVPDADGGSPSGPSATLRRSPSLRRCLSAPYRLWEQARFLPNEEDVTKLMQSDEEPDKFSKIDIVSRKVFPIAFGSMLVFYYIMYGYYISDVVPGDEDRVVLFDLARPHKRVSKGSPLLP
ncbi:gamma-aminobutyric acid receptor subunit alpha-1-like [Thrips palmi]|uniref:Gamma-aminobutyric acid receptor subunit alpha-1-like n=1 Tax=Thrips palmi TaxID=161013 RepID=A0A6P8YDM5_THRPL|nr:gamma-aminobutyric acid receptor subunit alpha-1-like [Thrips palmi]